MESVELILIMLINPIHEKYYHFNLNQLKNIDILKIFLYQVFGIWCAFFTYSTSQFRLHIWSVQ